ncbi:coniferyl-alcohol dehydrogenase [Herbiconiux sp. 11R-BC]|uniref:coniferyl-alcohol dehydrogenase n=1 Tax=Herbiconiux sp. 11R-BC TaxID=3111637 RepID=UPI003C070540
MNYAEYRGRRVVVTGCSSGLGAATAGKLAEVGATVVGLSRRRPPIDIDEFHEVDLASVDSIEQAGSAITGDIDALFNCAGAAPVLPSEEIIKVNFLGTRLFTELLLDRMPRGSAIASVSSSNGSAWRKNFDHVSAFVATTSFDEGVAWYSAHQADAGHGYPFSKEALTLWTLQQASILTPRGIRINSISPGAVQTPLLEIAQQTFPAEMLAATLEPFGRASTVREQVSPLLFLNSSEGSYINGADLAVDGGYAAAFASAGGTW